MKRCKAEFVATLEQKHIEIALLRTKDTLREYGLTSPTHDPVRSPLPKDGGKSQSPNFTHDKSEPFSIPKDLGREEDFSGHPRMEDKTLEIETLRIKLEECRDLGQPVQENEDSMTQTEKDLEVKIENPLDIIDSFEKKLILEVLAKEQVETRLRESQRQIKFLQGHLKMERDHSNKLEGKLKDYKGRLDAAEEAINEMVDEREKLHAEVDDSTIIFQERIKELKAKLLTEAIPVTQIPIDEYAFLQDNDEALVNLYNFADPLEKNLIAEAFMNEALVPNDLTFLANMVMGSVHLRAFMSMPQNEQWRDEQMQQYQILLREAPYEIRKNLEAWEEPLGDILQAFTEIHNYHLYRAYAMTNKIKAVGSNWIGTLYYPSLIFQPLVKNVGEPSLAYQVGMWLGAPHNSEAIWGELPGGRNLQEVYDYFVALNPARDTWSIIQSEVTYPTKDSMR
eukprot:Gb_37389 [translate_table: standard]